MPHLSVWLLLGSKLKGEAKNLSSCQSDACRQFAGAFDESIVNSGEGGL